MPKKHALDGINMDAANHKSIEHAQAHYLGLVKEWKPYHPAPVVKLHEGIRVVRDDLIVGTKARGGDALFSQLDGIDTVVYTQARAGLAGVSLLDCGKHYDKRIVLFMAASKAMSIDQACCVERGAKVFFRRAAAMNNLASWAKDWVSQHKGSVFAPLGLKHELVTAGIIKSALRIKEPPDVVFTVIATGVLSRALQIAWPHAKFYGIAVGRNLHAGEAGRAKIIDEPLPFLRNEAEGNLPSDWDTVPNYDGKAWKYVKRYVEKYPDKNVLFWNVGKSPILQDPGLPHKFDTWCNWDEEILLSGDNVKLRRV